MPPPRGSQNPLEGPGTLHTSPKPPASLSRLPAEIYPTGDYDVTSIVHNDTYPAIDPRKANLSGKSVFIAGASKGIGAAMAISFARGGASHIGLGARSDMSALVPTILSAAKEAGRSPPQVLAVKLDVADRKSCDDAAEEVGKAFGGRCDVVIMNAGILKAMQPVADTDPDEWWDLMTVNLKGPYLISRAFLPLLLKSETKTLITVTSVGALLRSPTGSAYQTSKLAALRLSEFVDVEYRDQGIVSFGIHPGNIPTDIVGGKDNLPEQLKHGESRVASFPGLFGSPLGKWWSGEGRV